MKTLTIDGKEYPIKKTYRIERHFIDNYPSEKVKGMGQGQSHDMVFEAVMMLLKPNPFKTKEEIMDVISPEEFNLIDKNFGLLVYGITAEDIKSAQEKKEKDGQTAEEKKPEATSIMPSTSSASNVDSAKKNS